MLVSNSYFENKVKSIGFENAEGRSTVGVMEPGEYRFGTTSVEYMTVISGSLKVLLPEETEWQTFGKGETFIVAKDKSFALVVSEQSAYHCRYEG